MEELSNKWARVISEWRASGLSQNAYSRESGHSATQLSYWKRRLEGSLGFKKATHSNFVELLPESQGAQDSSVVELEFRGGLVLRIRS
jgi:hypothetical protein